MVYTATSARMRARVDCVGHSAARTASTHARTRSTSRRAQIIQLGRPVWNAADDRQPCNQAATRAQARPAAVAERHGHSGSRVARQPCLCQLPCRWALARARKARLICSGAASRLNCLMGVQLGFMGVQLGGKVIWAGSQGCGCGAGTSGQQQEAVTSLPCQRPDDGAPRSGCRRPALACSSIPADRGHRFRRSGTRTGHAARAAPRHSPAECRPGRPLSC